MKKVLFVLTFFFSLFLFSNDVYAEFNLDDDIYTIYNSIKDKGDYELLCKYDAFVLVKDSDDKVTVHASGDLLKVAIFNIEPDSMNEGAEGDSINDYCPYIYMNNFQLHTSKVEGNPLYFPNSYYKPSKTTDTPSTPEKSYDFVLDEGNHKVNIWLKKNENEYKWKFRYQDISSMVGEGSLDQTLVFKYSGADTYFSIDEDILPEIKEILDKQECTNCSEILQENYQICSADSTKTVLVIMSNKKNCADEKESLKESRDPLDKLLGDLKMVLPSISKDILSYNGLTINGKSVSFASIDDTTICDSEDCSNPETKAKDVIGRITDFCDNTSRFNMKNDYQTDCRNFNKFKIWLYSNRYLKSDIYGAIIEENKIYAPEELDDIYVGCDFVTGELKDKLNMFLNIFKIAGPVLAIVLGMLDFAKVIFNEDADKQTKEAWKRFKTRIIAAAMLFLVPMLLSMLLNIFIGDQINNNPYCGLLDIEEKS